MNVNNLGLNASLLMGSQSLINQQVAISTIGNNISNINTPGYARQRANLVTDSQNGVGGEVDMGSTVSNIESLVSPLLDGLVQQSLSSQGYANNQATQTSTVQTSLGEDLSSSSQTSSSTTSTSTVTGSGPIQDAITSFFSALQSLASTPSDATARQVVVTDAQSLTSAISGAYQRLQTTQSGLATDASSITDQVNQLTTNIASLNQQITESEAASGTTANDLRDTRESDLETLSGLVNITTTTQANGQVDVSLADDSSVQLVDGEDGGGTGTTQSLSVAYDANSATPVTVIGSTSGTLGTGIPSSGSLGSDLDVANNVIGSPAADGDSGLLGALDGVASSIISQVNTQNGEGFDMNDTAGGAIFTGTGASDMAVNSSVANDPSLIAAGNGTGTLDGSNALAMSQLGSTPTITPAMQTLVSGLGETVSEAATNQTTQDQITTQLQTQQSAISGVSIDEEMTNLINYQNAYAASARFITTISSLYSTLTSIPTN